MCMNSEAVEQLHELSSALKAEHADRDRWLADYDKRDGGDGTNGCLRLDVSRAEAESIFAARIAAHEARLKDLGWTRTIRVEPTDPNANPIAQPKRLDGSAG